MSAGLMVYIICDCLSENPHIVCTKTEFNFIATVYKHTQYLSIPGVSSVKCLVCFPGEHFVDPPKAQLEQGQQWRAPIRWWGPKVVPTASNAALCRHHGCSKRVLTGLICQPPPPISPNPPVSYTDIRKEMAKIP